MNKVLAVLAVVSVPLVIIASRHFNDVGWPVTVFIIAIWAIQMFMMLQFMKYTRLQYECPSDYVYQFMERDAEGAQMTRTIIQGELTPSEYRQLLQDFGEACFRRGVLAAQARQNPL